MRVTHAATVGPLSALSNQLLSIDRRNMIKQQQNERMTSNFRRRHAANEMMRRSLLDEEKAVALHV